MGRKNYYTYRELLYGLRAEYQRNQKLIEELKKLIEIISTKECDYSLKIKQGNSFYQVSDYPSLLLRVTKKQNSIKKIINKLEKEIIFNDNVRWRKRNADFIYREDVPYPGFVAHNSLNGTKYYHPSIIINDEKGFHEIYKEVQKSKLFQLPESTIVLNNFQNINICGDKVELATSESLNYDVPKTKIVYKADDDQVHLKQDFRHDFLTIESLLNTEIPCYAIPVGYLEILERNVNNSSYLMSLDEQEFNKEDILPLFDKPKVYTKN